MEEHSNKEKEVQNSLIAAAHKFENVIIFVLVGAVGIVTLLAMARLFFGLYNAIFVSWDLKDYHAVQGIVWYDNDCPDSVGIW